MIKSWEMITWCKYQYVDPTKKCKGKFLELTVFINNDFKQLMIC